MLKPKLPTPDMCAGAKAQSGVQSTTGEGNLILGTVLTVGAIAGIGTLAYFLLKK
jgi:hypothetical protein